MEFRKTILQAWIVMKNSKGYGKSWKVSEKSRIMWNFYNCTEKFCNECEQWVCRQFSLLQPAGTVTANSGMHSYVMFRLFRGNVVPIGIGHGNSFRLVLDSYGKVMKNDFPKRMVKCGHPVFCTLCISLMTGMFMSLSYCTGWTKKLSYLMLSSIYQ